MPDKDDYAVASMEADVKRMAQTLRPVVGGTLGQGLGASGGLIGAPMPDARERVTVGHIHKALDALTQQAQEQANAAWAAVGQLAGANESGAAKSAELPVGGPVFDTMARQITQVGAQLERLRKAHEAMQRVLS